MDIPIQALRWTMTTSLTHLKVQQLKCNDPQIIGQYNNYLNQEKRWKNNNYQKDLKNSLALQTTGNSPVGRSGS